MTPGEAISSLDRFLAERGEIITLRLVTGDAPNEVNVDVDCVAGVDAVNSDQIAAGIKVSDLNIIISPTQINAAGWPGLPASSRDARIPVINGPYKVVARGEPERTVVFVDAKILGGQLVRINMRVSG